MSWFIIEKYLSSSHYNYLHALENRKPSTKHISYHKHEMINYDSPISLNFVKWLYYKHELEENIVFYDCCQQGLLNAAKWIKPKLELNKDCLDFYDMLSSVCRRGDQDILHYLLQTFDINKFFVENSFELLEDICENGHLDMLMWTINYYKIDLKQLPGKKFLISSYKSLESAQWCVQNLNIQGTIKGSDLNYSNLEYIKYIYAKFPIQVDDKELIFKKCCFHDDVFSWFQNELGIGDINSSSALICCCQAGNLNILKLIYNCHDLQHTPLAIHFSSIYGHLPIIKYVYQFGSYLTSHHEAFDKACKYGHLETAKWLWEKRWSKKISNDVLTQVCARGHVEILDWLEGKYHPNDILPEDILNKCCNNEAFIDNIPWFIDRFDIHLSTISNVIQNVLEKATELRQYHVVKYLIQRYDLKQDDHTIFNWCCEGHLELLMNHKYEFNKPLINFVTACINGHLNVAKWFYRKFHFSHVSAEIFNTCCLEGHIYVVKWLHSKFTIPYHFMQTEINKIRRNHSDVYLWLVKSKILNEKQDHIKV